MNQVIDFSTLTWVKKELDETLREARQALEGYVENPEDTGQLDGLAARLHQVYGTLQMVELYGASLLAEEMEQVALAMIGGGISQCEDASEVLMRAILQLPDYLDRLISGHRDVPLVLLPLLNDLRALRGESLLSESVMFNPDLGAPLPAHLVQVEAADDARREARELRHRFQIGMLGWLRKQNLESSTAAMRESLDGLQALGGGAGTVRLWWAAGGLMDAVANGDLESSVALNRVMGQVDREIKRLIDEGELPAMQPARDDLFRNLLFYCAQAPASSSDRVAEIQATYRLKDLLPDEREMSAARESLSGANSDLFETVAVAVKEELSRIKDSLDIVLRNGCGENQEALAPLTESLRKLGDTLGMLGLGAARKSVVAKADELQRLTGVGSAPADTALMDVASTLLLVESSVDNMGSGRAVAEDEGQAEAQLAQNEYSQVMGVVIQEAISDLVRAKEAIVTYIESDRDADLIAEVPQWFNQVKGGMLLLGETRPASLVDAIARYIRNELIESGKQASHDELDALADAVCGLEYFLEGRREHRMYGGSAMAVAEQSVGRLGYPADQSAGADEPSSDTSSHDTAADAGSFFEPEAGAVQATGDTATDAFEFDFSLLDDAFSDSDVESLEEAAMPESAQEGEPAQPEFSVESTDAESTAMAEEPVDAETVETSFEVQMPAAVEPAYPQAAESAEASVDTPDEQDDGLGIIGEDVDDEILEIFIEEAEEEMASIDEQLPRWLANGDDSEALATMRRSWHTLKGSGRLVGAMRIGEFAWAFENMLNRVIDGTVTADSDLRGLLQSAASALPELVAQVRDGTPTRRPIARMMRHADALSRGETFAEAAPTADEPATDTAGQPLDREPAVEAPQDQAAVPEAGAPDAFDAEPVEDVATPVADDASFETDGEGPHDDSVMDPLLYEIFNTESRTHLEVLGQFLAGAAEGRRQIDESQVRAMHTLHGSAHMADANHIAELAGALEKLLKTLMSGGVAVDDEVCGALESSVRVIESMLSSLPQESTIPDSYPDILDHVNQLNASVLESAAGESDSESAEYDFDGEASGYVQEANDEHALSDEVVGVEEMHEASAEAAEQEFVEVADASAADEDSAAYTEEPFAEQVMDDTSVHTVAEVGQEPANDGEPAVEGVAEDGDFYADHDQDLLEIFLEESVENLETADAALGGWRASPDDGESLAELQRALHTIKGGARMADLPAVGDVAHAVESLIMAISEQGVVEAGSSMDLVQQAQDCLAGMLEQVRNRQPVSPANDLVAMLNAQRERAPAAAEDAVPTEEVRDDVAPTIARSDPYGEVDPELLAVFIEEAGDILEHCDQTLQSWKRARDDQGLMAELQRELHTLKGGARMADITEVGDLAHAVESLMVKAAAGEVACDDGFFGVLERSQDCLTSMIEKVRNRQPLQAAAEVLGDLEKLHAGQAVPFAATARSEEAAAPAQASGVAVVDETEREERRNRPRASQELIRVRADLLDNLVNFAGEVSIYRSRLEQQVGAYGFNLVEMEQTVARVREQLRKLEIETEAQVLYGYEREGELHRDDAGDGGDFDPLEMDRYSHMQQLSRSLMESVSDLSSIQALLENITRESETLLLQQSRVNTELQEGLMRTRMVPFLGLAARMRRIVRQTAQELGKKAELELSGAEGEMDRTVVDRIIAPIEHMLRNAISHGIETPEQRIARGKPESGTIRITLERESSDVVLRIADDGAGISMDAIRNKAIQRGLMDADSDLGDNEVLQFILETGFSTAEKVTQVAGRGVGMDVVNSEVKQLGGSLHIGSVYGQGTTFTIRLPFTLALNQALLVEVGEDTYAIPLASIEGIVRMRRDDLKGYYDDPEARFEYGGYAYEVRHLGSALGTGSPHLDSGPRRVPVLLVRFAEHCVAFHVENLLGSREIVVKSVGPQISTVPGVSGATILGDGRVVMILEIPALLRGGATSVSDQIRVVGSRQETGRSGLTVMVVDDSITVRKVTTRILERNDMHVIAAKDGVDAVSKLQENIPDIMLLDIEMPRMDGFELATHVRNEPRLRDIPIIMITSRTGDKHRQRAMQIGVNRYLGKPFQESELLENIQALLEETALDG